METHFVIAGSQRLFKKPFSDYNYDDVPGYNNLPNLFMRKMKKYSLKSALLTTFKVQKHGLINKEKMENISRGQEKLLEKGREQSVNDDLESFIQDLRLGEKPDQYARSYFLPMLTKEEMKSEYLVNYLATLQLPSDDDDDETETKAHKSNSIFADAHCIRETYIIRDQQWVNE